LHNKICRLVQGNLAHARLAKLCGNGKSRAAEYTGTGREFGREGRRTTTRKGEAAFRIHGSYGLWSGQILFSLSNFSSYERNMNLLFVNLWLHFLFT